MNRFAELLDRLAYEPGRNNKLRLITNYFREVADPDRGYALAALTGALSFKHAKAGLIRDLIAARKQTKNATVAYEKKLSGLQSSVQSELAAKASNDDVNKLNGDVTGVKGDLDATKNSIQMARSEMGTLIARNHDEIDTLRRMGQRDYYEFTITRKGGSQKVGSVEVELRDTNTKKNQYTINVLADDKNFEKKNRSVNEPIFFYTGGSRAALELVVNKVSKTSASGYLSVPKSAGTASASFFRLRPNLPRTWSTLPRNCSM